jgi:hypothetical protein
LFFSNVKLLRPILKFVTYESQDAIIYQRSQFYHIYGFEKFNDIGLDMVNDFIHIFQIVYFQILLF